MASGLMTTCARQPDTRVSARCPDRIMSRSGLFICRAQKRKARHRGTPCSGLEYFSLSRGVMGEALVVDRGAVERSRELVVQPYGAWLPLPFFPQCPSGPRLATGGQFPP